MTDNAQPSAAAENAASAGDVDSIRARVEAHIRDLPEQERLWGKAVHSDPAKTTTAEEFKRLEELNLQANDFYKHAPADIRTLLALVTDLSEQVAARDSLLLSAVHWGTYVSMDGKYMAKLVNGELVIEDFAPQPANGGGDAKS